MDQVERQAGPLAQHRLGGVVELAQADRRPAADGGQRRREPRGLHHGRRRGVEPLLTQGAGDPDQPGRGEVARVGVGPAQVVEEVLVPAGGADPGAVAGGVAEAGRRPRGPRGRHLGPGQPGDQVGVAAGRREAGRHQHRGVPRPAHHRDPRLRRGLDLRAQHPAHPLLAPCVAADLRVVVRPGVGGPDRGHRLPDRVEARSRRAVALLDGVLPPPLGVVVARCRGERADRVEALGRDPRLRDRLGLVVRVVEVAGVGRCHLLLRQREDVRRRQVEEPHGHAVGERPARRDPLRREARERVERRLPRLLHGVDQSRDRRHHVDLTQEVDDGVELRAALDQDEVGRLLLEGGPHRPGGAGTVVAYAVDVDGHGRRLSPGPGTRGRGHSTRGGCASPSRGTPATPAGPARGP